MEGWDLRERISFAKGEYPQNSPRYYHPNSIRISLSNLNVHMIHGYRGVRPWSLRQFFSIMGISFFHHHRWPMTGMGALVTPSGKSGSSGFHGPIRYSSLVYSRPSMGLFGQAGVKNARHLTIQKLHLSQRLISFGFPASSLFT